MADIVITAANVARVNGAVDNGHLAGSTITAGQVVYLAADNSWKTAAANASAVNAGTNGVGIALCGAASGQPVSVQTSGSITAGGTLTQGAVYCVSPTAAGGLAPRADVTTAGHYMTVLGVATSSTVLKLAPIVSDTAI